MTTATLILAGIAGITIAGGFVALVDLRKLAGQIDSDRKRGFRLPLSKGERAAKMDGKP